MDELKRILYENHLALTAEKLVPSGKLAAVLSSTLSNDTRRWIIDSDKVLNLNGMMTAFLKPIINAIEADAPKDLSEV